MTHVTVLPDGITFEATVGETLMGAAQARGLYWPTTCGGQGVCTTCISEVVSGSEALNDMGRSERKTLVNERGEAILKRPMRLACQATCLNYTPVVLQKNGVRPAGAL